MNTRLPLHMRPVDPRRPFLLAADVDGTLIGDQEGEACLMALRAEHPGSFCLAVITGRDLASVRELIAERRLPAPDYIAGSVGSEILAYDDPGNALGLKYAAQVSGEWDLEAIYALGTGEGVWPQEFPEGRPRFQAGFYWDGRAETLAALGGRLAGVKGIRILPSAGVYVDVLPDRTGKGEAVRFLQRELGVDPDRVVVAGDAGNDREMFQTGYRGIVPANAHDELRSVA